MHQTNHSPAPGRPRAAVIGAGVSGLTAAKCLLDEGIEPVVFERAAAIGGLWNFDEGRPGGGSPAYRSLRTNTSRQTMAFSDYPFPDGLPDFPHRAEILHYLQGYVDHFDLRDRIRLRATVERVTAADGGGWTVRSRCAAGAGTEQFSAVLVCSGLYTRPATPTYPGAETYQGALSHAGDYSGPEEFAGQEVVVVGAGSSAADIAVELSRVARRVVLSTTNGAWFIPRYIGARPYDHQLTRLARMVPWRLRMRLFRQLLLQQYRREGLDGRPGAWGLPEPVFDIYRARLTVSTELLPRVAAGALAVRPAIARLDAREAVFVDETRARADTIIFCTGYTLDFPFLDDAIVAAAGNGLDLYRRVFHPDPPHLAFVGFCIVAGPIPPVAELQARWIARVVAGAAALPTPAAMREEIAQRRARLTRLGAPPLQVQLLDYLDDLAGAIGARPRLLRHPILLPRLLLGPPTAAQYRLDGHGRWRGAPAAIRWAGRSRGPSIS